MYPDDTFAKSQNHSPQPSCWVIRHVRSDPSAFGGTPGQGFWQEMISFYENPSDIAGTQERLEQAAQSAYE